MSDFKKYTWFAAGYILSNADNEAGYIPHKRENVIEDLRSAVQAHEEGKCIVCRKENVVLLDGVFCELCYPGVEEVLNEQ